MDGHQKPERCGPEEVLREIDLTLCNDPETVEHNHQMKGKDVCIQLLKIQTHAYDQDQAAR